MSTGNNYTCSCMDGFSGTTCDMAYCDINECLNNGVCNKEVCCYVFMSYETKNNN